MNPAVDISQRDARRIAIAAQGFTTPRPAGRVDRRHFRRVLDQLGTVQLDSVNVLTRSHELIFFARLGTYDRDALTRWLWGSREVFEYWGHEASLHPVERHPLFRWAMARGRRWGGTAKVAQDHPELVEATLAEVVARGPIAVGELESHGDEHRRRGESWWGWGSGKRVLEWLFASGQVTAVRRNGFTRYYLPTERWLSAEILELPLVEESEAQRELILVSAKALGVATAKDLADYYRLTATAIAPLLRDLVAEGALLPARVEGWRQPAYLHPDTQRPRRHLKARALLSPFDSLIWERHRTERLWDFRYRIEIYTPAPKRVHGYYVLPFLLGESLVGRVDLKADRKAGVLLVQAAWIEPGTSADPDEVATELAAELSEMAAWLGLADGVTVVGPGDLAPALEAALA